MSLKETDTHGDEIWFGEAMNGKAVMYVESAKSNLWIPVTLTVEELKELRTEVNNMIIKKVFNKKIY